MSNIVKRTASEIVLGGWTREEVELVKTQINPKMTDGELALFAQICERTGLDPFSKQIYSIHRSGKMTVQTSIDGYRLAAARSNAYAGSDDATFEVDEAANPVSASVTVYRMVEGQRCPFHATARMSEYRPSAPLDAMWKRMPHTMIAKCAEALALRKAFPAELSGVYVREEMHQAETPAPAPITAEQAQELVGLLVQGNPAMSEDVALAKTALVTSANYDRARARALQLIVEREAAAARDAQDAAAEASDAPNDDDDDDDGDGDYTGAVAS